tara:strand:+ start:1618 stop:2085 length:468 start_codon:yes stop_codon:yes gene_type:complete
MKFKLKSDPLLIAVFLILAGMGTGQVLLYRESNSSLISHCRELNRQNITLYNLLAGTALLPSGDIKAKTKNPAYCEKFIGKVTEGYLKEIDSFKTDDFYEELNISAEKIRLYSDNYQKLQNKRSKITKNLLFFSLIINLIGLFVITFSLRFDKRY